MKVIGLTGGVASGKNYVADIFKKNGAVVFDADAEVHKLLDSDKSTIEAIKNHFPEAIIQGRVNRKVLAESVLAGNADAKKRMKILEGILHPKVREKSQQFLKLAKRNSKKIAVLNIPLLLEKKGYKCDVIVAIITSKMLQKYRFFKRTKSADIASMEKKFTQIKAKQISDARRIKAADYVIYNLGVSEVRSMVKKIIQNV